LMTHFSNANLKVAEASPMQDSNPLLALSG